VGAGGARVGARMSDGPSQRALADFVSEAQETIEALDRSLARLEETRKGGEADVETLNAVFRAAHSLKGLAAMFGVERMLVLAHALEDRLDDVRMGRSPLETETLGLLAAAPVVFGRIIAEEAAGKAPASEGQASELALRLRDVGPRRDAAADPLTEIALDDAVRTVLTEYEEHRLRTNLRRGARLYRIRIAFDLASFDSSLEELRKRLKPIGEIVSTLPSPEAVDPHAISFDVLLGSIEAHDRVREAAGPAASVEEIPRAPAAAGARGAGDRRARPEAAPGAGGPRPQPEPAPGGGDRSRQPEPASPPASSVDRLPPGPSVAEHVPSPPGARLAPAGGEPAGAMTPPAPTPSPPVAAPAIPPGDEPRLAPPARDSVPVDASLRSVSQAVRVDIHKLDRLMNLVGELVLVKTSLLGIAERLRGGEESTTLGLELQRESRSLERKLNELQGGILEVRMVPLEQIFDKLARMVRKLARDLGKKVDFEVRGGDVELDKLIVEDLSDPLMHLIRNALDHAIEAPEERARLGKPPAGRVTLAALQKGSHVLVSVEDDGAGIDEKRLRDTAVARGLCSLEATAQLSRRDALNLIFLPGFSTTPEVTELSGRGVGLDVVKNNIAAMSGIIDLHTAVGKGTRFEITLPVTLAIIRALVVSVAGRAYAMPLNSVLEIVTAEPAELRTIETREVISLRGSTLPILRLAGFFGFPVRPGAGPLFIVVVGLAQERLGIAVDGLVGQQDIVVKPLGSALAGVRGIAGATDLGNRRTILVLDVGPIIEEVVHGERLVEAPE
jgi:two-component system chemotaxis sensor kinase CheA